MSNPLATAVQLATKQDLIPHNQTSLYQSVVDQLEILLHKTS